MLTVRSSTSCANLRDDDVNRSLATFAPARSSSSPASNDPYATTAPDPYATQVTAQGENLDVRLGKSAGDAARFRIIRPHAEGGLGSVYVARIPNSIATSRSKEIQFDKADNVDNRNRFTLEAEITGGLEHPGIVPVYGLGTYADGRPYYAMKFIRGDSLKDAIDVFHKGAGQSEDVGARNLRLASCCNALSTCAKRSTTPTRAACCTATSSPATSCWGVTAKRWSSTGAWLNRWARHRNHRLRKRIQRRRLLLLSRPRRYPTTRRTKRFSPPPTIRRRPSAPRTRRSATCSKTRCVLARRAVEAKRRWTAACSAHPHL
ncbi:MAG: hypothetical protein QM811_14665 [Pirellulales bacterium]